MFVTRSVTWPLRVQTRYCPPENALMVRVSSTAPVTASIRSMRSVRDALSQSNVYTATWCGAPSMRFTSIVKPSARRVGPGRDLQRQIGCDEEPGHRDGDHQLR